MKDTAANTFTATAYGPSPPPLPPSAIAICPSVDIFFLLTATVADTDVGEAPDVAHANTAAHHGQDVVSVVGPRRSLLLVIFLCPITIVFLFPDVIIIVISIPHVTTSGLHHLWRAESLVVSGWCVAKTVIVAVEGGEWYVHAASLDRQKRLPDDIWHSFKK